jgi:serine/threonine-protein kinase RsbW
VTEPTRPDGDVVEVWLPADTGYVATLRLITASLAARCDLTIDDIEDLRLAVDEACALLLPHAKPATTMQIRFELLPACLVVTTTVDSPEATVASPDRTGFAWSVLSALATSVDVTGSDGRLAIVVTKRRETTAA